MAITDCNMATMIDPSFGQAFALRGLLYKEIGNYNLAIRDFSEAIRLNSNPFDSYFGRAESFFNLHDYNKAIDDFRAALNINESSAPAHFGLGFAYKTVGLQDAANAEFERAKKLGYIPR